MKGIVIAFAGLLALAVAAPMTPEEFTFQGNVSFNGKDDFKFRFTALTAGLGIATYTSAYVDAQASGGQASANLDAIFGSIVTPAIGVPFAWISYIKGKYSGTASSADISSALGAVVTAYQKVNEVDPSGKVVKTTSLAGFWNMGGVVKSTDGHLKTVQSTRTLEGATVTLSFIVSDIVGVLNYGNAIVSPKTIEMVLEIENYNYASTTNHLELVIGAGLAKATFKGNAMVSGKDDSNVYLTLRDEAVVDGSTRDIKVKGYVDGELGTGVDTVFKAAFGGDFAAKINTIVFPAGAKKIVYDPALGQGKDIVYGAAPGLVPSILLIALIALLVL